ncbi:uncharacterized protein LOC107845892 isoform X2 [Capsicum annuum]|uniref:uncharacterized protein LOC107845892 isoform X2 n=1 Tax=Capsicum annuum TaxID=4072 RepID=UPI001FB17E8F|nr:uncharacterized protein LOC107845892 isoform X2 [Capsicum annuum]
MGLRTGMLSTVSEVVAGSAAWLGRGLSCVCAQRRESDARPSFDLTPSQEECLLRLQNRIDVAYDSSIPEHRGRKWAGKEKIHLLTLGTSASHFPKIEKKEKKEYSQGWWIYITGELVIFCEEFPDMSSFLTLFMGECYVKLSKHMYACWINAGDQI